MKKNNSGALQSDIPTIGEINRKIAIMILPITVEGILEMISGIISMGMVGRISVMAVSALGISMQITQIIWALLRGLSMGETVYVAHYFGAGRKQEMIYVMQQTIISVIILSVILSIFTFFGAEHLLAIFNPRQELLIEAVSYIKIVSFGFPFLAIMLAVAGAFQGMSNSKIPMMIALCLDIINIAAAYLLIFGKGVFPSMGIRGAAVAILLSEFAAALIGLALLFRKNGLLYEFRNRRFFRVDIRQIVKIYRIGIQSAMETIFWLLAGIVMTRCIMTFGETTFAAHQLGVQAESISYMPASGFGIAATAFIGQALGAGNRNLSRRYLHQIMKGAMMVTAVSVAVLLLFPKGMMQLLTNNSEVIRLGTIYLILTGLVQLQQNAAGVLGGAMRGAGYTRTPMIVAGIGLWGIRVPLTLIFTYVFELSIVSIWITMSIDLTFRFFLCLILFKKYNIYQSRIFQ